MHLFTKHLLGATRTVVATSLLASLGMGLAGCASATPRAAGAPSTEWLTAGGDGAFGEDTMQPGYYPHAQTVHATVRPLTASSGN